MQSNLWIEVSTSKQGAEIDVPEEWREYPALGRAPLQPNYELCILQCEARQSFCEVGGDEGDSLLWYSLPSQSVRHLQVRDSVKGPGNIEENCRCFLATGQVGLEFVDEGEEGGKAAAVFEESMLFCSFRSLQFEVLGQPFQYHSLKELACYRQQGDQPGVFRRDLSEILFSSFGEEESVARFPYCGEAGGLFALVVEGGEVR